ncbi:MAG TPA: MurR/RpiR family transcriptional regulator [Candidatus Faecousia faecavium]|nr:MurR/RpiR family transcriptional regulator [Candidatus Faecousia faecavium]
MFTPVISKIISMQQSLTVSENEIAQYVINHPDTVVTSTITAIARNTNTSEASINRFCKKIGFKGFNSFKVALAQDTFYSNMQRSETQGRDSFITSISKDYNNMLVNTTAMLDDEQVFQAANAIRRANRIYIFSSAATALIAHELEFKLGMAGIYAKAVTDSDTIYIHANNVAADDLVIAIAPTLFMRDFYRAVALCKENGAALISITSYDSPKLSNLIDYKFIISDKITTRYSVSISNSLMFLYTADVLYCALLESDKTLKQNRLNNDSRLNSQQRMDPSFFEY